VERLALSFSTSALPTVMVLRLECVLRYKQDYEVDDKSQ
jgi:hypothetical protein